MAVGPGRHAVRPGEDPSGRRRAVAGDLRAQPGSPAARWWPAHEPEHHPPRLDAGASGRTRYRHRADHVPGVGDGHHRIRRRPLVAVPRPTPAGRCSPRRRLGRCVRRVGRGGQRRCRRRPQPDLRRRALRAPADRHSARTTTDHPAAVHHDLACAGRRPPGHPGVRRGEHRGADNDATHPPTTDRATPGSSGRCAGRATSRCAVADRRGRGGSAVGGRARPARLPPARRPCARRARVLSVPDPPPGSVAAERRFCARSTPASGSPGSMWPCARRRHSSTRRRASP